MRTAIAVAGVLLVLVPAAASGPAATTAQLTVDAKANIFGAGQAAPPAPAGGGAGVAPPSYSFSPGEDQVLLFTSVAGRVTCCNKSAPIPYNGPEGGKTWDNTAIPPVGGISGVSADKTMFLVGVFLGPGTPGRTPPPTDTFTRSPKLQQVFYVGDGRGAAINVPDGATRLYLGFADGFAFKGQAGAYSDNAGTITADFTISRASGSLVLSYTMPKRFGLDTNRDRLIDYVTTPARVSPREWTATVQVGRKGGKACDLAATYTWTIDGRAADFDPRGTCLFTYEHFPQLRTYRIGVTATTTAGKSAGSLRAPLKDLLIAGLGDSNGSGEGNPDISGVFVRWQDKRCDRSANSFEAQAALTVETKDPRTSVTFVHLACSGASVPQGMIGPYRGINDPGGPPLESQVSQLQRLVGTRRVDAVLLSIGVNDLGFSDIVSFCLNTVSCPDRPFEGGTSLDDVVTERLAALPTRYERLAARLNRLGIRPNRVFITEYFDSTRDSDGEVCDPLISVPVGKVFSRIEAEWAFESVLAPLNRAVASAASAHGWTLVSGAQSRFRTHGYCSDTPWIVGLVESLRNQRSRYGTLHANVQGHRQTANLVLNRLRRAGISR